MTTPTTRTPHLPILLASSSIYRAQLLVQLGLTFTQASPNIDESQHKGESATDLVARLSEQKAQALCENYPGHIIIASDQVAVTQHNKVLGKPGNHVTAVKQLKSVCSQKVTFLTGLCLLSPNAYEPKNWHKQTIVEPFTVFFRELTDNQIEDYVSREMPFDCAGSFKFEGLGISLFTKFEGDDPNTLIGLPLIQLCTLLDNIGLAVLAKA